jgi:chromosomal replication initiator protein
MEAVYDERKDLSLPSIGKLFCRDHTTILHAVRKVKADRGAA